MPNPVSSFRRRRPVATLADLSVAAAAALVTAEALRVADFLVENFVFDDIDVRHPCLLFFLTDSSYGAYLGF